MAPLRHVAAKVLVGEKTQGIGDHPAEQDIVFYNDDF
jgi:hypothetical protein